MTKKEANEMLVDFRKRGYTIKIGDPCYQDPNITRWNMYIDISNKEIYISKYTNLPSKDHN